MRLKSVCITEYKNLKNFELTFDGHSFIDIFVGKNGSGKSNLFEALLEIFRHLYEFGKYEIRFDYMIKYEFNDVETEISWKEEKLRINGKERKSIPKKILPDNILIYYSGHNAKVSDLVQEYENAFKSSLRNPDIKDSRKFIGIGKEYKQLLLAVLLLQPDANKAKQFICSKLGINSIDDEIKITLRRPSYAKKKKEDFEIDPYDETSKYWKADGINKKFLKQLSGVKAGDSKGRVRDEGYFKRDKDDIDEYILYYDIKDFQKKFKTTSAQELFRQFDNLKIIEMLHDITITVVLENGLEANINHFSDGQLQSVYIYSIIELFKDRNCLTLLDEPDSFLHPEWQYKFLQQVFEITDSNANNNHVLLSSHSAVTLIQHDKKKIKFFDIKNNVVNWYDLPKHIAINKLSSDLIKYSEQEQLLSIINTIQIEKKPVFFTEGSTDPIIIKTAWYKLFEEEIPFIPFYAFSCTYLYQLLTDNRIIAEMNGLPLFGMFDFDKAYNQWNGINGINIEKDPTKGLIKKRNDRDVYAIMLPVPANKEIRNQVIKSEGSYDTFCDTSHCEIEHLFYGSEKTKEYFQEEPCVGGKMIVFKNDKETTGSPPLLFHQHVLC